jgi:hypothetical protein
LDGNREPLACVDASLDVDLHDGRVHAGHDIQMANGHVIAKCGKLQKVSFSIPGAEYMWLSRIKRGYFVGDGISRKRHF